MSNVNKKMSEFGFIEQIQRQFKHTQPGSLLGIGDDAAAVLPKRGTATLLTTDTLIEGVHFNRAFSTFEQVGQKAVAVNVSDIAAMGGTPRAMLVSLGVPEITDTHDLKKLYRGISKSCKKINIDLIGGNTARTTGPFFIAVTLYGEVMKKKMVRRDGAKAGDVLYVTGFPGEAAAGLELLKQTGDRRRFSRLVRRHQVPEARWEAGQILARENLVSAMIDLSDGLAADLNHILMQSQVGAMLEEAAFPISPALRRFTKTLKKDILKLVLYGGDDYELLFSVPLAKEKKLLNCLAENQIQATRIGEILPKKQGLLLKGVSGRQGRISPLGFDHFRTL